MIVIRICTGIPPTSLKSHVFLVVIVQLPSRRQALYYFTNAFLCLYGFTLMVQLLGMDSLGILRLLFLLLVVAGDVERNPGPTKTNTGEGQVCLEHHFYSSHFIFFFLFFFLSFLLF